MSFFLWSSRPNLAALLFHPASYHVAWIPSRETGGGANAHRPSDPFAGTTFSSRPGTTAQNQMSLLKYSSWGLLISHTRRPLAQMMRGLRFQRFPGGDRVKSVSGCGSFNAEQRRRASADWFHCRYPPLKRVKPNPVAPPLNIRRVLSTYLPNYQQQVNGLSPAIWDETPIY